MSVKRIYHRQIIHFLFTPPKKLGSTDVRNDPSCEKGDLEWFFDQLSLLAKNCFPGLRAPVDRGNLADSLPTPSQALCVNVLSNILTHGYLGDEQGMEIDPRTQFVVKVSGTWNYLLEKCLVRAVQKTNVHLVLL